jgi:diaminopimelate dehydrogenase
VATRQRLAIVGFGRLGQACARAAAECPEVLLAGVVRRPESAGSLEAPFSHLPVASHLRDLERVDAVLLCVPPAAAKAMARDILQFGMPLVECAMLEGHALDAHHAAIDVAARHHRVAAVVGAGWNPGMLALLERAFDVLIPSGHTVASARPGTSLHHTEAARNIDGVIGALATESRDPDGHVRRYVYAQLAKGADAERVRQSLRDDPLFAGEETLFFPVPDIAALEQEGHGLVLERRGTSRSGAHQNLLLEARFDVATFAARVMLDAAARLPALAPGAHPYSLACVPRPATARTNR